MTTPLLLCLLAAAMATALPTQSLIDNYKRLHPNPGPDPEHGNRLEGDIAIDMSDEELIANYQRLHPNTGPDPEHGNRLEGDIAIDDRYKEVNEPDQLNAIWDLNMRWPNNVVYYTIRTQDYTGDQLQKIEAGIKAIVTSTMIDGKVCVDIKKRTQETNFIQVFSGYDGCWSHVGMIRGLQQISLQDWCVERHGTIIHEFLHAMGFYHEHTRGDRDDYVFVNFDNIEAGAENNFQKLEEGVSVDHMNTTYDYGSVLHYGAYGFAIDPEIPTIVPVDPEAVIGQRVGMSAIDIERVQIFYCCLDPAKSVYHKHLAKAARDYC